MKLKRLFVVGDNATDDVEWYCGGPGLTDALSGLRNLLEGEVGCLLRDGGESEIRLLVKEMTDEEVAALPDV